MGLFGAPNIEKLQKEGNVRGLVKLMDHKDSQLASQALAALQQLTDDKEAENHRITYWELYEYAGVIKKIEKLDQDKQKAIILLTEKLKVEKAEAVKKGEEIIAAREELKKQFEKEFKSSTGATDHFWVKLMNILGENKEWKFTTILPGKHTMSSFSGVIITNDELIYFELNLAPKVMGIRFDDTKSFEITGLIQKYMKIQSNKGDMIKIPVDEAEKEDIEIIAFIESRISETKYQKQEPNRNQDSASIPLKEKEDKVKNPVVWNLKNGDKKTKNNAALSLINSKDPDASELILTQILNEGTEQKSSSFFDTSAKEDLVMTLLMNFNKIKRTTKTVDTYINALASNDITVIRLALVALEKLASTKAIEPLEELAQKRVDGLKPGAIEKTIKRIKKKNGIPV